MSAWTMGEKYEPLFREIRGCLGSEALDGDICRNWEENGFARSFGLIRRGIMSFSQLQAGFDYLMEPLYYCRFIGVVPALEHRTWGGFFPDPEQGARFWDELRLYRAGRLPVSEEGRPWLFRKGAPPRTEASAEQKQTLFRLFDATEQTPFAARFLGPPAGLACPQVRFGAMYGNGRLVYLRVPLPAGMEPEKMRGRTCRLPLGDGSEAVLALDEQPCGPCGRLGACGYVENYTRRDAPTHFLVDPDAAAGQVQLSWIPAPGETDTPFCVYDRTLPRWAPFTEWFEKERDGPERASAEKVREKGKALMDALYRTWAEA